MGSTAKSAAGKAIASSSTVEQCQHNDGTSLNDGKAGHRSGGSGNGERGHVVDVDPKQLAVTIAALKLLLGRLYALTYQQLKIPHQNVSEIHNLMLKRWSMIALLKSSDLATSDVMSDDVLREIGRFLEGVEKDYNAMK
jgi:hypothetical protein